MAQYIEGDLPTKLVKDGSVPFAVIIPIKRQMNEKIPLILNLHGGGGSRESNFIFETCPPFSLFTFSLHFEYFKKGQSSEH